MYIKLNEFKAILKWKYKASLDYTIMAGTPKRSLQGTYIEGKGWIDQDKSESVTEKFGWTVQDRQDAGCEYFEAQSRVSHSILRKWTQCTQTSMC